MVVLEAEEAAAAAVAVAVSTSSSSGSGGGGGGIEAPARRPVGRRQPALPPLTAVAACRRHRDRLSRGGRRQREWIESNLMLVCVCVCVCARAEL